MGTFCHAGTRRDRAHAECTRDPIFLLQCRSDERLSWITVTVFLTREEGEAWGEANGHRWAYWRVYCVPCEGELAQVLNQLDAVSPFL